MAHKQLLLSFLVNILGEFVSGLTEENLKVGVWGGKIKLKNLQINRTGLEKMNLPLSVQEGYCETLEVKIPWTNLDKQAVQITVTGVHLLVAPVDFSTLSTDSAAARCREKRKDQLDRAERVIEFAATNYMEPDTSSDEDMKSTSYKRKILRKMAKNLEVSFHDVHFRYEDCTTLPNENFNFGVTMDSFVFKASAESGADLPAENEATDSVHSLMSYKLVNICNLGLYWNVETSASDIAAVFSDQTYNRTDWDFIICPSNQIQAAIALNYAKGADPQTTVTIDNLSASLQLEKFQLHQAIVVQKAVVRASLKLELVQHRPRQSAVDKPVYWWKYMIMLFTNNPNVFTKKVCLNHPSIF
jgi:vacuolar protein sorting-associated protein 13A/C